MKKTVYAVSIMASVACVSGALYVGTARSSLSRTLVAAASPAMPAGDPPKVIPATASRPSMETLSQTSGPWLVKCLFPHEGNNGPAACLAQQKLVTQNEKKQPVTVGGVIFSRERQAGASVLGAYALTVELPQGLMLEKPATVAVDGGAALPLSWATCAGAVCIAHISALNDAVLSQFTHGKVAHLQFSVLRGGSVSLDFTLQNLDEALTTIGTWAGRKSPL